MIHSFTTYAPGIVNQLRNEVEIYVIGNNAPKKDRIAVWDTGAMKTTISKVLANELGLVPLMYVRVKTPSGRSVVPCYIVDIVLPNDIPIPRLLVLQGLLEDFDVLIGMDIISRGDFSVTNWNSQTVFSFRTPSVSTIDFTSTP